MSKTIKKAKTITKLTPFIVAQKSLVGLVDQEKNILVRHFGLDKDENITTVKKVQTLDQIGKSYGLTRERIRQIESRAVDKIKKVDLYKSSILPIRDRAVQILKNHGGIVKEDDLLREVLDTEDTAENRRSLLFMLNKIFIKDVANIKSTGNFLLAWRLQSLPMKFVEDTVQAVIDFFKKADQVMKPDIFWEKFRKTDFYQKNKTKLSQEAVLSFMIVSKLVNQTFFGEWGLTAWGIVNLKRVSNKIFMVFKDITKPLHFREITALINEKGFDSKTVYAPTVHNELIADKRFMLLGRGVYALTEWGYLSGTTAEVIEKILKESGGSAHKDDLIKKVLEHKAIKKQTVLSVLINSRKFKRGEGGYYILNEDR